jgi:hypothetical protein
MHRAALDVARAKDDVVDDQLVLRASDCADWRGKRYPSREPMSAAMTASIPVRYIAVQGKSLPIVGALLLHSANPGLPFSVPIHSPFILRHQFVSGTMKLFRLGVNKNY